MGSTWTRLLQEESGQGLTEYAVIIALISIGLVLALTTLRGDLSGLFGRVDAGFNSAS